LIIDNPRTTTVDKDFEAINEKIKPVPRERVEQKYFPVIHERLRFEKQMTYPERVEIRTVE